MFLISIGLQPRRDYNLIKWRDFSVSEITTLRKHGLFIVNLRNSNFLNIKIWNISNSKFKNDADNYIIKFDWL